MSIFLILMITSYILSLIFLSVSLRTNKKLQFLISAAFVVLASLIAFIEMQNSIQMLLLLAIVFSYLGDLFMAKWIRITRNRIINGIIGFGIAHILYIVVFINMQNIDQFIWWIPTLVILLVIVMFYLVGYKKGGNRIIMGAVLVYMLIIGSLFAAVLYYAYSPASTLSIACALIGIILFMISDSTISYNEFKKPLTHARKIIPLTYVLAQIFLQISGYVFSLNQ